ncbi:hypothetical protein NQD34_004279 [Periophthalmus magnuspinnatus]|nr:hypothetical protein NQD34_004279 [Periophthalmus magnuspinnatus]
MLIMSGTQSAHKCQRSSPLLLIWSLWKELRAMNHWILCSAMDQVTTNLIDIKTLAGNLKPRCPLRLRLSTAPTRLLTATPPCVKHALSALQSIKRHHLGSTLLNTCSASFHNA